MKRYFLVFAILFSLSPVRAQVTEDRPKLVVGIVVDQMRYDYLTRFWDQFGDDGFKRMINNGYTFKNNHFNYVPTYTGPGHASVFTGTTPASHGIIGNGWYDKSSGEAVYCVSDPAVNSVGTESYAGQMSPHRLLSTTFADENRLFTQMKGKTIGVALKDRGAILPAGHTANAAYWFNGMDEANWISSTYYLTELPKWVQDFNTSGKAESYLKTWNMLKDPGSYTASGADENDFEFGFKGQEKAIFPYDLKKLAAENGNYDILKASPFGNDLTAEFAKAAIKGESLGKDKITDVLTLSFSSTDYVGHNFGVNSKEIEDTYLRLDATVGEFLKFLDKEIGEGQYTVFLTADHGAVDVPAYLKSRKIPSGYYDDENAMVALKKFTRNEFRLDSLIKNISNSQIFLNHELLKDNKMSSRDLQVKLADFLLQQDHISKVFTREQLQNEGYSTGINSLIQNGFNQKRSGDIIFVTDPGYIVYPEKGTTHGSGFSYDTHVPLIFFGKGIKKGSTYNRSEIPDIAPTISALLGISFPNAASGKPLSIMLDK